MAAATRPARTWIFFLLALVSVLVVVGLFLATRLRNIDERTRVWVVRELSRRFASQIEIDSLHVQVWPRMTVHGDGLTVYYRNRMDVPPLIHVREFDFNMGFAGLLNSVSHIDSVILHNVVLTIPPRTKHDKKEPAAPSAPLPTASVIIDKIVCDDTDLLFLSKRPGKDPLDFDIHDLILIDVGIAKPFRFRGNLTNAKPTGEIATDGPLRAVEYR